MNNNTHEMSADPDAPYKDFGLLLEELRQKVGISQQAELGALVKASQQSVSRWEAGTSRPRTESEFLCLRGYCEFPPTNC